MCLDLVFRTPAVILVSDILIQFTSAGSRYLCGVEVTLYGCICLPFSFQGLGSLKKERKKKKLEFIII